LTSVTGVQGSPFSLGREFVWVGSRSNMIIEMRGMSSLLVLLLGPAGHGISQDSHYQIPSRILRSPSRLWQSSSKFPSRKPLVMSKISYSTVSTLTRRGRLCPHRPSDVRQVFGTVFRHSLRSDWYSSGRCCLVLPVGELSFTLFRLSIVCVLVRYSPW
jgi:hypothetical protein